MVRITPLLISKVTKVTPFNGSLKNSYATYNVSTTDVKTTTHEHAQKNPIMGKKGWQHPSYGRKTCTDTSCTDKICDELCGPVASNEYVGHATHDPTLKNAKPLSETDLSGNERRQYGVFYDEPVPNSDADGSLIDLEKTEQLHKDEEHLFNVHYNAKDLDKTSLDATINQHEKKNTI